MRRKKTGNLGKDIYCRLSVTAILVLLITSLLTGCARNSQTIIDHKVPHYLSDNIQTVELKGRYYSPLPNDVSSLSKECSNRGKDVINLLSSIKDKNIELSAIRQIESN